MTSYKKDASHGNSEKEPGPQEINALIALFKQGRYAEIEFLARKMTARFPLHGFGWKAVGTALLQQGRTAEALVPLQKAAELSHGDAQLHNNLGNALAKLGRLPEAETSYRQVLKLNPGFAEAHHNLGNVLQKLGRLSEAEATYRKTLELKPDFASAHNNLGNTLLKLGRLSEAEASYRRALELKPDYAEAHSNLGDALFGQGRLSEAEASYRQTLKLDPSFIEAHHNLGSALLELDRLSEAEASYNQALKLKPDYAEAHINLSLTLLKLGRLEEAETSCRRALQVKPDYADAHNILNNIFREQGLLPDYLTPEAFDFANGRLLQRYFPKESNTFIYCIDVSGTCNLRCPSCPVGNFSDASRPKGFMKLDLFRDIVKKIKRDRVVANPKVWLFIWGEPLLHPKLSEMISILKQNDLYVVISTNLNIKKNLEEVICSGPDEIKISLSGFTQEFYSKTHTKGNIEVVKENMNLIRDLMNKFNVPIKVWVGHHLYRHNSHESIAIKGLCRALGFDYSSKQAFYSPLEKMVDLIEGRASASEADLLANLPVHPLDRLAQKQKFINNDFDCEARFNMTAINYDGSVALCCGTYDSQNMLDVNFLDAPHDEIQKLKYQHPFCKKCYAYGLQYSYCPKPVQKGVKVKGGGKGTGSSG